MSPGTSQHCYTRSTSCLYIYRILETVMKSEGNRYFFFVNHINSMLATGRKLTHKGDVAFGK